MGAKNIAVSPDLVERNIRDEVTDEDLTSVMESVAESSKGDTAKEIRQKDQVYTLRK